MSICEFTTEMPKPGKFTEARAAFLEFAHYLNENIAGVKAEIWCNLSGPRNAIYWVVRCDSLADWEKAIVQFRADEKALASRAKVEQYLENPEGRDCHFYRIEG